MDVTLLGSGDAVGMPVPLCECEYCQASQRRRRPGLLVETATTTLLLDAGPDIATQLRAAGVTDLNAVFLTHAHYDHSDGLHALVQAGKWPAAHLEAIDHFEPADDPVGSVYLTNTAHRHLRETRPYLVPILNTEQVRPRTTVPIGDLRVTPFAVEHARPEFETLGFVVAQGGTNIAYAPDVERITDVGPAAGADFLFVEGAALFGTPLHGPEDRLRETIEQVGADTVILVNLSEHKARRHTGDLDDTATALDYCLGDDGTTVTL